MNRRTFLGAAAAASTLQAAPDFPIIDCHIHLFDIDRPQGVPWPPKTNTVLYKTALPDRYRKLAVPLGIKGAIEVECSTWLEDNQWVLDVANKDKIMVGTVGNLEPGKPDFRKNLDRFHKDPLFRGIRYGNLWNRPFHEDVNRPDFIADMKALADATLALDVATAGHALFTSLIKLTDKVPELRVIIDHLPQANPPADQFSAQVYETNLRELGKRKQIYVKVSEVLRRVDGKVPLDLAFYKPRLDQIFETFGEDRLIFGSDWPNSDQWAEYPQVFKIAYDYFTAKGRPVAEKYFWKNSVRAYRWVRRSPDQPKG